LEQPFPIIPLCCIYKINQPPKTIAIAAALPVIPVRLVPEPTKLVAVITPVTDAPDALIVPTLNVVAVATPTFNPPVDKVFVLPEISNSVAVTTPTFRFGVPERPKEVVAKLAVDAVPVRFPTKLVAVITPTTRLFGATDCILVLKPARFEALDILLLLF
jgi:hypothetical protein